jgi:hypothetical protein
MFWADGPMPEREETFRELELKRIGVALHELCQPMTTLQCRLEMAEFLDTPEGYREAVSLGLVECVRLAAAIGSMRAALRAVMQQAAEDEDGMAG